MQFNFGANHWKEYDSSWFLVENYTMRIIN